MKRVALIVACLVLVVVTMGPVSAESGYTVHVPVIAANVRIMTRDPFIESLIQYRAEVRSIVPDEITVFVGRFTLDCADPASLASPDNVLRDALNPYGSPTGPLSAWDPEATNPPGRTEVVLGRLVMIERLTENANISPRLDTSDVLAYLSARAGCE